MDSDRHIFVGTAGFGRQRPRYARKLSFVEIEPRPPFPATKVFASWRSELGKDFRFALVAPAALWGEKDWPLRDDVAVNREFDRFASWAKALEPEVIVLRTPAAIRPGSAALERFLSLTGRVKRLARRVVWEPAGVWEREAAVAASKTAGLVVACDPLRDAIDDESIVYAWMRGLGSDRRYHSGRLEDLADALETSVEAYVVFDTEGAFREATRLEALISGAEAAEDEETIDDDEDEDEDDESGGGDEDEEFDEDGDGSLDDDEDEG
jgi:uncharacterized protein YecE (DUF72 family)